MKVLGINNYLCKKIKSAYKPIEDIISCIGDSVDVIGVIKPIFNYKSGEDFTTKVNNPS